MENAIRKENTYCGIEQSVSEGKVCFCFLDIRMKHWDSSANKSISGQNRL